MELEQIRPRIKQAYRDTQQQQLNPSIYDFLKTHQASWFCQREQRPQADALIIQGFRDVLFPFNEGVKATKCLQEANRQVHLIGVEGGHLQPFAQHSPLGSTPFGILENLFVVGIKRATIYKKR